MKKGLCIVLLAVMLLSLLAGCKKNICQYCGEENCDSCTTFTCESCGKEKAGKQYKDTLLGKSYLICQECYDGLKAIGQ